MKNGKDVRDAVPGDIITNGINKYKILTIAGDAVAYTMITDKQGCNWINIDYFTTYWIIDTKKDDIRQAVEMLKKHNCLEGNKITKMP